MGLDPGMSKITHLWEFSMKKNKKHFFLLCFFLIHTHTHTQNDGISIAAVKVQHQFVAVLLKHCMNISRNKDLFHIKHFQARHIVPIGKDGKSTMNFI